MKYRAILAACLVLFTFNLSVAQDTAWKSKKGFQAWATLEGFAIDGSDITLSLKKKDGKVIKVPFDILTEASQAQAMKLIQKKLDKAKVANAPPPKEKEKEEGPKVKKNVFMGKEEYRTLVDEIKTIRMKVRQQGTSAASTVFVNEAREKLAKQYGQFRIKLIFPVENVSSFKPMKYKLHLGACFLGGLDGRVPQPRRLFANHKSSAYVPIVTLLKNEMLEIGKGTHQYEMIALICIGPLDNGSNVLFEVDDYSTIPVCYVQPQQVEFKLVKIKKPANEPEANNAPPAKEPEPIAKQIPVMTPEELQTLANEIKAIHAKAIQQKSLAAMEIFRKESVDRLSEKYGQFRIRLIFPVEDVQIDKYAKDKNMYRLRVGGCIFGLLHGGSGRRPESIQGRNIAEGAAYIGGSSSHKPLVQLERQEVLSIGKGTHHYEMIVLVTLESSYKQKAILHSSFYSIGATPPDEPRSTQIYICYVLPKQVEGKLVKIKK